MAGSWRPFGERVVVFVSVNQVLVRPWACRLRDGLPYRAVGRLAAIARVSVRW